MAGTQGFGQNPQQNNQPVNNALPPLPTGGTNNASAPPPQTNFGQGGSASAPPQYEFEEKKRGFPLNFVLLLILMIPIVLIAYFYVSNPNALIFQDVRKLLGVYEPESYGDGFGEVEPTIVDERDTGDAPAAINFEEFITFLSSGEYQIIPEGEVDLTEAGGSPLLIATNTFFYQNAQPSVVDVSDIGKYVIIESDQLYALVDPQEETVQTGLSMMDLVEERAFIHDPLLGTVRYFLTGNLVFTDIDETTSRATVVFDTDLGYPATEFGVVYTFNADNSLQSIEIMDVSYTTSYGTVSYEISESNQLTSLLDAPQSYEEL